MPTFSSGSRTPARMPRTSSEVGGGPSGASGGGEGVTVNKTSVDLENMPELRRTVKAMDLLAVLKALGDETRFSMYRELAGSTAAAQRDRARRPARPPRQHRAPAPRTPARGRPRRGRSRAPRHGRAPAARLLARRRARPASASTRPATRCSPGCSPRWPSASAPTATKRPRSGGRGAPRPAAAPARARASRRSRPS